MVDYAELHVRSAFSMLDGSSTPETLARRAADLDLDTLALTDLDDLGGAVRFDEACKEAGVRPIVGAELSLSGLGPLVLLCEDREGYANLSSLITLSRMGQSRGLPAVELDTLQDHAAGLVCLSGGRGGPLDVAATRGSHGELCGRLAEIFRQRFYLELHDHCLAEDVTRNDRLLQLARSQDLPWVVSSDARHATARSKPIHDALRCIKHQTTLTQAGDLLFPNDARCLRSAQQMARTWRGEPAGMLRTLEVAERCRFRIRDLAPGLPRFTLPAGVDDADALLEAEVRKGLRQRCGPHPSEAHLRQVRHELDTIRRLQLAGYFLIVWDIVRFARQRGVLVQGRGSAANSVVCYCLGITSVDPVRLELLFERFLSEGRGEPPDIDVDIAHRDREEVLQYVYTRYGRKHAAMVCEVNTYRGRSAVRDAARVLDLPVEVADKLASQVGPGVPHDGPIEGAHTAAALLAQGGIKRAGLDPRDGRMRALVHLLRGLEGLPRHRSIHVGGFVLTGEPLCTVVPIEPAAMDDRTVIQWDKDDLPPTGLIKIDLLGLGMLTLLSDAIALVHQHRGEQFDIATLPADDRKTYRMLQKADTVGVFQVESRAQMGVLPRLRPERFYDLVVQVALIRPGPIQGEMVHPYLRRRRGEEPIDYLHSSLEPVLQRTLGVPLFQEQGMRVAVAAAGFTPSQADELRRAMGFRRHSTHMARISLELLQGMEKNGIERAVAERIVKQLGAFSSYGFPESHAASFAILVYASAYLKRHYTPEFYAAILNAQPMGFYSVGSLVADAKRHKVEVRAPDITRSRWDSTLEPSQGAHPWALRLGVRLIHGLGARYREGVDQAQQAGAVDSIQRFAEHSALPLRALKALARAGAFDAVARNRRQALWEVLRIGKPRGGPLDPVTDAPAPAPLPELSPVQLTLEDYLTVGASSTHHPVEFLRKRLDTRGVLSARALHTARPGPVHVAGLVTSRQRPSTAKGFVFVALEDETGMVNVVTPPALFEAQRRLITQSSLLEVQGELERRHDVINVRAIRFHPLSLGEEQKIGDSHDFH